MSHIVFHTGRYTRGVVRTKEHESYITSSSAFDETAICRHQLWRRHQRVGMAMVQCNVNGSRCAMITTDGSLMWRSEKKEDNTIGCAVSAINYDKCMRLRRLHTSIAYAFAWFATSAGCMETMKIKQIRRDGTSLDDMTCFIIKAWTGRIYPQRFPMLDCLVFKGNGYTHLTYKVGYHI